MVEIEFNQLRIESFLWDKLFQLTEGHAPFGLTSFFFSAPPDNE